MQVFPKETALPAICDILGVADVKRQVLLSNQRCKDLSCSENQTVLKKILQIFNSSATSSTKIQISYRIPNKNTL